MNDREILSEVLSRADKIEKKKARKKTRILSAVTVVCSLILVVSFAALMPSIIENGSFVESVSGSLVGSLFANTHALGYIIVGIVAFVIGVVVTLLCYRWKRKNDRK